ncbi:asparaginase [Pseudobacteroides cellulosolvens]|uniref:L-asparaginase II n=1 Tax=Pseudobacteroides cellulosolvens ATCC 35603 = DSM 2933 TaxID=398512 RepID=A0A0L6JU63_9FIRM|nr:asparaginase [Pseudobacteroides cellulosolvens]KNY29396.1 L-asparaginase II [Pseudobacteroides cellulosolvens ATCC 35603 = DSM 2933]
MEPLAIVTRDGYIESIHYGYICVVNSSSHVLYNLGDLNTKIFLRSSAKPIQAIPLIQSGAAHEFNFSNKEIAIACASHSGQKIHQETVEGILNKLDLNESNLHCGIMTPYNDDENKKLISSGKSPSVFHCSCSGKHSAMLALAKFRGFSIDDYESIKNPIQQEIIKTVAAFTDEDPNSIPTGIDGCGAPIYLMSMNKIALSYARLVMHSQTEESPYYHACKTVFDSMTQFPDMVAGDNEFCTELMKITKNKLIGKVGSEAVYCIGIKEGSLGICIKIADGNERAIYPVVIHTLKELGILSNHEFNSLKHWYNPVLKNNLNEVVGKILPTFSLNLKTQKPLSLGAKYQ